MKIDTLLERTLVGTLQMVRHSIPRLGYVRAPEGTLVLTSIIPLLCCRGDLFNNCHLIHFLVWLVFHSIVRQTHLMSFEMICHGGTLLLHLVPVDPTVMDDLFDELKVPGMACVSLLVSQRARLVMVSLHYRLATVHDQVAALALEGAPLVPGDVPGGRVPPVLIVLRNQYLRFLSSARTSTLDVALLVLFQSDIVPVEVSV